MSLEINQAVTVPGALQASTKTKVLDGDNKVMCTSCGDNSRATKCIALHRTLRVLQLHLKRLEISEGGGSTKIVHHVTFPESLDVSAFMSQCKEYSKSTLAYTLYAVIVHTGPSTRGGHYLAYVKDSNGERFEMNDHKVSLVSLTEV